MKPIRWDENGRTYVAYRSAGLTFRRDAWDLAGPVGTMIDLVGKAHGPVTPVTMTQADVQRVFPNVLKSRSWRENGLYSYSTFPAKAGELVRSIDDLPARCREWVRKEVTDEAPPRANPKRGSHMTLPVTVTTATSIIEWSNAVAEWAKVAPEAPVYLESVKAWRDAWRPKHVRFLLVAESHVGKLPRDTDVRVTVPARRDLPSSYCRLVYCLGYGGSPLCDRKPDANGGTWQYWEMLASVEACAIVSAPKAIAEKLRLLASLKDRGIWLVDASVTACYVPGERRRFETSHEVLLVRDSWERFVWPEVEGDRPEQVWVIGVGVGEVLRGHPAVRDDRVIPQPQIRDRERYLIALGRMVESICKAERQGGGPSGGATGKVPRG